MIKHILIFLLLFTSSLFSQEICDNGIDDDNDGLIDCYDPDCCESILCSDNYFMNCPVTNDNCFPPLDIQPQIKWIAPDWHNYNTPILGDIDNDGIVEIIGKPELPGDLNENNANLMIVNGVTGTLEHTITTDSMLWVFDAPAIADVNSDGIAEIFIATENDTVYSYSYSGGTSTFLWKTAEKVRHILGLADFNQDGIPELYGGATIVNSINGNIIMTGDSSVGAGASRSFFSVAVDVLPTGQCADCAGLELVAGNVVYSINIDPGNPANNRITPVTSVAPTVPDGRTSIADVDRDGDLDAIVAERFGIYIWDLQTPTLLAPTLALPTRPAQVNIGNFDGDPNIEFGVCEKGWYHVYEYNAGVINLQWEIATTDFTSGVTGSILFDFNSDGQNEVVYRDETDLKILNGVDGTTLWTTPCASGTGFEYPVVADIDNDNQADLLCSCSGQGLVAFESPQIIWPKVRNVWNQHNYFNVNINDDLTVPQYQQSHHIIKNGDIFNTFLTPYVEPGTPYYDVAIDSITVNCSANSSAIETNVRICNLEDSLFNTLYISYYGQNPYLNPSISPLVTDSINTLDTNECIMFAKTIPRNTITDTLYIVVNDSGNQHVLNRYDTLINHNIFECNFLDNFVKFYHELDDSFSIKTPSCPNTIDGEIETFVTASDSPWDLFYNNTLAPSSKIIGLTGGTYNMRIRDAIGCENFDTITISSPSISLTSSITDTKCFDDDNGVIHINSIDSNGSYIIVVIDSLSNATVFSQNINTQSSISTTVNNLTASTYIITLSDTNGCMDSSSVAFIQKPPIQITTNFNDSCTNTLVTLNAEASGGSNAFTYYWEGQQLPNNFDIIPTTDTIIDIYAIDDSLCPSDTLQIQLKLKPILSYTLLNDTGCEELAVKFTPPNYPYPTTCYWDFGNGTTSTDCAIDSALYAAGIYTINYTVTFNNGCSSNFNETVFSLVKPEADFTATPELTNDENPLISFQNLSLNSNNFEWYFDSIDSTTAFNPTYLFPKYTEGEYPVTLIAYSYYGCSDTITKMVKTYGTSFFAPNSFTPDGDGLNDFFGPSIINSDPSEYIFEIYNRWGKRIYHSNNAFKKWDGKHKGIPVKTDSYVWKVYYKYLNEDKKYQATGHVNVLR